MVFDQFSDPSFKQLFKLACEYPEVLRLAEKADMDFEKNAQRSDESFAWRDQRMFPIDTCEQAILSRLYIEKQAAIIPDVVRQQCEKALALYDVNLDLTVTKIAEEPAPRRRSAEEVRQTANALISNTKVMDVEEKAKLAVALVKEAVDLGLTLPALVLKSAGATMMDSARMKDWIEARKEATEDPFMKEAFEKLAMVVDSQPELVGERNELLKLANVIAELDMAAGLERHYGKTLPDPVETVFNTEKIADDMVDVAGRQVPLTKLMQVAPQDYRDIFGEDLSEEFIRDEEIDPGLLKVIMATVPRDLQKVLMAQMPQLAQ